MGKTIIDIFKKDQGTTQLWAPPINMHVSHRILHGFHPNSVWIPREEYVGPTWFPMWIPCGVMIHEEPQNLGHLVCIIDFSCQKQINKKFCAHS
jgi:hypothetical protein